MIITNLSKMPYAQAAVHICEEGIALVSYVTTVAVINKEGWVIVGGLYSATTRRHLSAFASEYCGTSYYTLKKCYTDDLQYNIHTKEFYSNKTGEVWTE